MTTLDNIRKELAPELESMNEFIDRALATDIPLMSEVVRQYLEIKGKQIRPVLVLLSAKLFGEVNESTLHAAAALEMLHNATLIHDDVVDETMTRRGRHTVNCDFGNRIAVLVGDFFVSNALAEAVKTTDMKAVVSVAELGEELSLGEIDQIANARDCTLSEERYFEVIDRKTASLFRKCARMGAESVNASEEDINRIVRYAGLLGLCFQIKDDIFDYFDGSEIGKPTGNDLRENKVSLPLLHALNNASEETRERIRARLIDGNLTDEEIAEYIAFAKDNGGIEYAYSVMEQLKDESLSILATLPAGRWRDAFAAIFDFTISRHS